MGYIQQWEKEWDKFYDSETNIIRHPSESVVRFINSTVKQEGKKVERILDVGCGNGRHIVYLAKEGFRVCGIDISQKSLDIAAKWLSREGLLDPTPELKQGCITAIPYMNEYFDIVICFGVLDHLFFDDIQTAIAEIDRVLKPEGIVFLSLRSTRDTDCGRGDEVEHNTFMINGNVEAGLPQHFFDAVEIKDMLVDFSLKYIECEERLYGDFLSYIYSRWVVVAEKASMKIGCR
ncbi:class I SAM-dependent methyltransferase [Candidatus Desantisbacteria bacterium]|nr:class I SAM-dependent methyltransferase [Candidatus Desantisbacteria bacterium]